MSVSANIILLQADRACGSSAHVQSDSQLDDIISVAMLVDMYPSSTYSCRIKIPLHKEVGFDGYIKSSASRCVTVAVLVSMMLVDMSRSSTYSCRIKIPLRKEVGFDGYQACSSSAH